MPHLVFARLRRLGAVSPPRLALAAAAMALPVLSGCLAASVAGDVAEGAVRATGDVAEGAVRTTGAAAGAVMPGDGDRDEDDDRD